MREVRETVTFLLGFDISADVREAGISARATRTRQRRGSSNTARTSRSKKGPVPTSKAALQFSLLPVQSQKSQTLLWISQKQNLAGLPVRSSHCDR